MSVALDREPPANVNDTTPLLPSSEQPPAERESNFDVLGLRCLLIQHFSSAWGDRTAEFALYLYLIKHFEDTLLPSSVFGFAMTLSGILWSHWAGTLVDKYERLPLVRFGILIQKLSALCAYACCAIMLADDPPKETRPLSSLQGIRRLLSSLSPENLLSQPTTNTGFLTPLFIVLVFSGCFLNLSNICISIAVERDWATSISVSNDSESASSRKLSKLNTYLRQINLLCKLCAPIFVSFLTVKFDGGSSGSNVSLFVLSLISIITLVFELYWIGVVYRRFPQLQLEEDSRTSRTGTEQSQSTQQAEEEEPSRPDSSTATSTRLDNLWRRLIAQEWTELIRLPVFFSSLAVSLLYITVLSFDGIMVGYLKTLSFSDDLIAEMRGLCVVTGLVGTALALPLENKIGTVRAGNWSIWSMVISLAPVVFAFYAFAPQAQLESPPTPGSSHPAVGVVGAALIFGGMALSRIGLWSFDLIQTKQLQIALTSHPRRNALTALQYTMQNIASLVKFTLTMIFWRPSQFRWAATTSFASVFTGALMYMVYVKNTRGHIVHLDWIKKIL